MTTRVKRSRASKASSRKSRALEDVVRLVKNGRRFLVASHRHPDGDTLGSALGLAAGLKKLGKKVKLYNADAVPDALKFLPGAERVTSVLSSEETFDACFVVDCSDLSRVGEDFQSHLGSGRFGRVVVLDHHARGTHQGDLRLVDAKAASSGVVVYRVLRRLGVSMTREIATNLFVTLVTDTGNFRYANTSADVFALAEEFVRSGVSPDRISLSLHEKAPRERLKLLARALETLELVEDDQIGIITVTREMLRETGGSLELADDFVDYPRSLKSIEIAVLFRESEEGWRVSLRSKSRADVGAVAERLGGGGHVRAAGFTGRGELKAVRERTIRELTKELSK
jgi:bifunctional oligoribonuclease and PAP phosphatase NrnA